uniref:Ribosomal protein S8 n=2 Tax=Ostreobium TaxID=121087 RepID=A0A1A8GYM1_9CHLO|nr:Ribosomal protein S8 [Ostreobium quekettii]ANG44432.1 ribosomal protein S8 [Ostreobium sp. OS1B]SBQ76956.1 Ribosomal protein S8 [Ostreobium quekettii]
MSNDSISDVLTQIRNANLIKSLSTLVPNTSANYQILRILQKEGFIKSFNILSKKHFIIYLKYTGRNRRPILTNMRRISKPGRRVYTSYKEIPSILGGLGIVILSTSKGILTDREARFQGVGGEVLCSIW